MEYPKKSLGQNFLIDKNITKKIVSLTDVSNQNIIEIGAGNGALTDVLIKKKPKSLILIEKDDKLVQILKSKYHVVSTSIPGQEVNEEWFDEQIGDFTYYSDNEYVTNQSVLKLNYDLYFKGSFWNDIKENKEWMIQVIC